MSNEAVARSALAPDRRTHRVICEGDLVAVHREVVDAAGEQRKEVPGA